MIRRLITGADTRFDFRGVECEALKAPSNEAPKAPNVWDLGRECSPSQLGGVWEGDVPVSKKCL